MEHQDKKSGPDIFVLHHIYYMLRKINSDYEQMSKDSKIRNIEK